MSFDVETRGEDLMESTSEKELMEWGQTVTGAGDFLTIQVNKTKQNKTKQNKLAFDFLKMLHYKAPKMSLQIVALYVRVLNRLCVRAWLAVRKILSHLEADQLATLYPMLAHDFPELAPSLIPRKALQLVLERGTLADSWDTLRGCTDELLSFKQALKQHPRLLLAIVCDKKRNTQNPVPKKDFTLSVLPLIEKDCLISASFHPSRPIAALVYVNRLGSHRYQLMIHAFGGVERQMKGSILYQQECNPLNGECSVGDSFRFNRQTPVKMSWSPTGEFLLVLSKASKNDWEIQLFRWNDAEKNLRRIVTHLLPHYSSKIFKKIFIDCWSGPSSFYTIAHSPRTGYLEFTHLNVTQNAEEVSIQTRQLKRGFPRLNKKASASAVWLLQGASPEKSCVFVWAEQCRHPYHPRHTVVRYRRAEEEEEEEATDTKGFVLKTGIVIGGEVDSADKSTLILLVAQPFNLLSPISLGRNNDDLYKLNWSFIDETGLQRGEDKTLRCGKKFECEDDDEDGYWITDYKARFVLFVVRVWAQHPDVPVVVNVLKRFSFEDDRGLVQKEQSSGKILAQTEGDLLIALWPNLSLTIVASKLLPVSYIVRDRPRRRFWHPNQQVYISSLVIFESAKSPEFFYDFTKDYDDDDKHDVLSPAEHLVNRSLYVVLKSDRKNNLYEEGLSWENCQPMHLCCTKKTQNQQECQTCRALQKRRLAAEWSNPLPSKVSKQT